MKTKELKVLELVDDEKGINEIIDSIIKDNPIDIYVDYRDLEYTKNLLEDCETREDFEERIIEAYDEYGYESQRELWHLIGEKVLEAHPDYHELSDELDEYILQCIYEKSELNYPFDEYLNQEIRVNVLVTFENSTDAEEDELDYTTLAKFLEKLGYVQTKTILKEMVKGEYKLTEDKFLNSLYYEIQNAYRDQYNFLTFIGTITVGQYFEFKKDPRKVTFEFNTQTTCGFFDPYNGGGSTLDIVLPKTVTVRGDAVKKLLVEGIDRYTVDEVYGLVSSCYTTIDLHRGMPRRNK